MLNKITTKKVLNDKLFLLDKAIKCLWLKEKLNELKWREIDINLCYMLSYEAIVSGMI